MKAKILKLTIALIFLTALAFSASAHTISGQVNGTGVGPLDNALVHVTNSTGDFVNSTNTSGGLYSLEVGNWDGLRTLQVSHSTYDNQTVTEFITTDITLNFELGPLIAVSLSGFITNSTDPLNNVDIKVKQGEATFVQTNTNADGFYNVSVLDGDNYNVTASLTDYISQTKPITIAGNTELNFTLTSSTLNCIDNDGDGYGVCPDCGIANGCTYDGDDCDDTNGNVHPGATEVCGDGIDNDCSGGDATCTTTPPRSSCFPAGTKILMEDGNNKNIEDIKVGDKIIGFDGNNKVPVEVLELESPIRDHMYTLHFEDESVLRLTKEHPIYTEQGWKSISPEATAAENAQLQVGELKIGGNVLNNLGKYIKIIDINFVEKTVQTYNLKRVSEYNNFFANGFLAHNKGGTPSRGKTYSITLIKRGVTVSLAKNDKAKFNFNEEVHEVTATDIKTTTVTLRIASTPVTAVFSLGDEMRFDLDDDGKKDLLITLKGISNNKANLTLKLIEETKPLTTITPTETTEEKEEKEITLPTIPQEWVKLEKMPEVTKEEKIEVTPRTAEKVFAYIKKIIGKIPYIKYIIEGIIILIIILLIIKFKSIVNFFIEEEKPRNQKKKKIS